jgi:hypothetical protein
LVAEFLVAFIGNDYSIRMDSREAFIALKMIEVLSLIVMGGLGLICHHRKTRPF